MHHTNRNQHRQHHCPGGIFAPAGTPIRSDSPQEQQKRLQAAQRERRENRQLGAGRHAAVEHIVQNGRYAEHKKAEQPDSGQTMQRKLGLADPGGPKCRNGECCKNSHNGGRQEGVEFFIFTPVQKGHGVKGHDAGQQCSQEKGKGFLNMLFFHCEFLLIASSFRQIPQNRNPYPFNLCRIFGIAGQ
ncbi:MAG: hypothetical protein FWF05_00010 [Oscillospiraceae bacterium]|nr:hypothetical protein [Oscillospiraceae bacterium]